MRTWPSQHRVDRATAARLARARRRRCVRPGGRVVLMDCVWPRQPLLRPIGWLIYRADRGEWMRTEEELVAIAHAAQPIGWSWFRYTVAYTGQEAIVLTYQKPLAAAAAA